jgi:hypothetical protein
MKLTRSLAASAASDRYLPLAALFGWHDDGFPATHARRSER